MGLFRKPLRARLNLRNKEPGTPRTPRTTPTKLFPLEASKVFANLPRPAPFFYTRSRAKSIVAVKPKVKRSIAKTPPVESASVNSLEIDRWRGSLSSPFNWVYTNHSNAVDVPTLTKFCLNQYGSPKKRRAASINQSGSVPSSLAEKENAPAGGLLCESQTCLSKQSQPSPLQHRIKRVPVKRITDSMIFNQATLHDSIPTVSSEAASILNASASLSSFGLSLASSNPNALMGSPLKQPSYRAICISLPRFPTSETSTSTLRLSRMDFGGSLLEEGFFGHDFNLADYIFDVPEEDESADARDDCDDKDSINIPNNDFSGLIKDETMSLSSSLCLSLGSDCSLAALAGSTASLSDALSPSSGQSDATSNLRSKEIAVAADPPVTPNLARTKWHSVMVRIEEFQEELSRYLPVSPSPLTDGKLAQDSPAHFSDSFACVAEELSTLWPMPPTTPIIFVGRPGIDW
jgi:hypothetical protein